MSLFKAIPVLVALVLLQACGFRPLYGGVAPGSSETEFALIDVRPIPDRIGQQLRNHLLTSLNPKKRTAPAQFILTTKVTEAVSALAVKKSAFATRSNLTLTADFRLSDSATGKNFFSSSRSIAVSYNILDSAFATLMAEKDARQRAVRELSEDIRTQLGVYFSRPQAANKG
ncbi:MAG: LPS assembly lipoprotein LptE [Proteobacteria bacterium]|nr:LPS assembly lipoprotein LptE [Pseudomonadota bacterium]